MNIVKKIEENLHTTTSVVGAVLVSIGVMGMATFWEGLVTLGCCMIAIVWFREVSEM
jgi:hypothetical protein